MLDWIRHSRFWRSVYRNEYPRSPKGRVRVILGSLALHLHPVRVPERATRITYTWGLGGLSIFMFIILAVTGAFLMLYYVPSETAAYNSIVMLETQVVLGQFIRNLHRWSAHVMVILVALHLVRVFYTGAYKPPRDFNWVLGIGLLLLTLLLSFTGYLLPWDQLAYWAVTVGTQMAAAAPLIGGYLQHLLLGGPEVGQATLIRWYALHVFILPLGVIVLSSLHFWRIRKDGGISTPIPIEPTLNPESAVRIESQEIDLQQVDQSQQEYTGKKVLTWPHLVSIELISALVYLVALTILSILIKAPLQDMANPDITPNPAKAPWYFAGLQELLLHMHPGLAGVILPALVLIALAAFPYIDIQRGGTGIWFTHKQGKEITIFAAIYSVVVTTAAVMIDEFIPVPGGGHGLAALLMSLNLPPVLAAGVVPLLVIGLITWGLLLLLHRQWQMGTRETMIGLFTLYLGAYFVLTIIGVVFRGPGMRLIWP